MRYRNIIILLALLLQTGVSTLQAQTVSESRTLEKSFLVKEGMTLDVSNKYGKIHLSTSTSDSVFIRIEMNASASKSSKLRKLIDGVAFDLTSTNHFVIAETRFEKGPINFIEGIRNLTNNIISSESKVDIDYYIYAPPYLDIKIDNRYGDVYIESTEADLDIKVVNGDLKAEDLTGNSTFDLNFCDATISSLKNSRISISYGDLNVSKAEAININSSSSKIDFDDIEELHSESKRDKYFIKGLTSLEGNSYFTDYNIDILREKINMTTRYGNVNIESIPPGFSIISLESSYTGVFLTADPETSFLFEAKLNNCNSSIPENWIIEEEALNIEKNEYLYFGDIGQETPSARVILKLTRGKLKFDQNN
jgi:hypothetical protein